jgi:hypothetical protein
MRNVRILALSALCALAGCAQNDAAISRRVQARLAEEGVTDQVKVTTERRVVVLEGVVADRSELNRVELAARNTPGIMGVDNRLVIQNPVNVTGGTATSQSPPPAPAGPTAPARPIEPAAP